MMPSKAISQPCEMRMKGVSNNDTWMDGLPRCKLSGVGVSQNQIYREDGTPYSEHEYEDRSIHFCIDNENTTFLYGVFDGHDGSKAANFASQRMPAELSFEQLEGKRSEEEVKEIFHQAFLSVENAFLESIDPKIAERTQLLEKIPDNMTQFEAAQQYPDTFSRLQDLEEEIRGGTTAVVALVHKGVLYVGNVGDSRALLCQKDKFGVLRVKQLTTDHTTRSHDELERLSTLSLDVSKIKGAKLGGQEVTRCLGSYFLKGGYREFDLLADATAEPVLAEPHVTAVTIDEACSFLVLMSDGLYKSYEEATGSEHANKEIATMIVEQFREQQTLTSVAQTVVDKAVRLHHDAFLTRKEPHHNHHNHNHASTRDDITLVIRNFHFHFPTTTANFQPLQPHPHPHPQHHHHLLAPNSKHRGDKTASPSSSEEEADDDDDEDLTLCENFPPRKDSDDGDDGIDALSRLPGPPRPRGAFFDAEDGDSTSPSIFHPSTTSSESSKLSNPSLTQLTLDEDGRITPYVSFDDFFRNVEQGIDNETIPKAQIGLYK